MPSSARTPFRVLTLDGGGVRGLYSAVLLHGIAQRVARLHGRPECRLDIGAAFNLIVGTSTGALLGTALAAGKPAEDVIALYQNHAKGIFRNSTPPGGKLRLVRWASSAWNRAANPATPLSDALTATFGEQTLGELYAERGIALCVPTINVETQKSWVFKTPHLARLTRDDHYRLTDVCLASSAAPILLPIHGIATPNQPAKDMKWFVDGGLWANNPVLTALTEALELTADDPARPIEILSISTCPPFQAPSMDAQCANRGLSGWRAGIRMMETSIDAQAHAYDYMARTIAAQFGGRVTYLRLTDPKVSGDRLGELRLDNPSDASLRALTSLGTEAVDINLSESQTSATSLAFVTSVFSNVKAVKT